MCADGLVFLILSGRHCAYTQRFQLEAISTVPATLNSLYIPSVAGSSVRYLMQHVRETMCDVFHINQASFALLRAPVDRLNICKGSHRRWAGIEGHTAVCKEQITSPFFLSNFLGDFLLSTI